MAAEKTHRYLTFKAQLAMNGFSFVDSDANRQIISAADAARSNSLTIANSNSLEWVGIASTSPWLTFSVVDTVGFDGLSGSTGACSLCLDANKQVVHNSASDSCLSSTKALRCRPNGDSVL